MTPSEKKEVARTLNEFGTQLRNRAVRNLKRKGMNASGNLSRSIDPKFRVMPNSFEFEMDMAVYGLFQDAGVEGTGGPRLYKNGKKTKPGTKWKKKRVDKKYFQFKFRNKKYRIPPAAVDVWRLQKKIVPRNTRGQFAPRRSGNYAIARAIYAQGLEAKGFFTQPYERLFDKLPENLTQAFALDVVRFLETGIQNAEK